MQLDLINGKYRPLEILEEEASYQVVVARDESMENGDAVLIKRFYLYKKENSSSLFEIEDKASHFLNGVPGIIKHRGSLKDGQSSIIIQDHVEAPSIQELIRKNYDWSTKQVVSLLTDIITSLRDIHDRGFSYNTLSSNTILYNHRAKKIWFSNLGVNNFREVNNEVISVQDDFLSIAAICLEILQKESIDKYKLLALQNSKDDLKANFTIQNIGLSTVIERICRKYYRSHEELLTDLREYPTENAFLSLPVKGIDRDAKLDPKATIIKIEDFEGNLEKKKKVGFYSLKSDSFNRENIVEPSKIRKFRKEYENLILDTKPILKTLLVLIPFVFFIFFVAIYISG